MTEALEVEIERILPGGVGLAHTEGMTLFVYLAAPGDRVRVQVERQQGNVLFASITSILTPSPVRVEPPCPYFGRCGGCDFQQMTYEAQLSAKAGIIRDCLHRIARLENVPDVVVMPSPDVWRYRLRATWQLDELKQTIGYYERGSRRVCDVVDCAVLMPELQVTLERLRATPWSEFPSGLKHLEAATGEHGVRLPANRGGSPTVGEGSNVAPGALLDSRATAPTGPADVKGKPASGFLGASLAPEFADFHTNELSIRLGNEVYTYNAAAFFQVNALLAPPLIDSAIGNASGELALDLYCGVGLFTLPLARRFTKVVGVESNPTASRFARRNLQQAHLSNGHIVTATVKDWIQTQTSRLGPVDFVLLDPPRAGAESAVIEGILKIGPSRICYVSCDPATLARDLKKLLAGGYKLGSIAAFDMFPQTHHVETVLQLVQEKAHR